ncbi:MAG: hypothetical protein ACM3U2_21420, partial [Deltaproteobacteria bacterium]
TNTILRQQISEAFRRSSEQIDREVAEALTKNHQYLYSFNSQELAVVFANIFHTLIDLQKFAGLTVPLIHNVASIGVEVRYPRITVSSLLHIHSPIRAFIELDYSLSNDFDRPGNLALIRRSLMVLEKTSRFDFFARTALAAINIEGLVERELRDPAQVIRFTLPHRLGLYGFTGTIDKVHLEVTPDNHLHTYLACSDGVRA